MPVANLFSNSSSASPAPADSSGVVGRGRGVTFNRNFAIYIIFFFGGGRRGQGVSYNRNFAIIMEISWPLM